MTKHNACIHIVSLFCLVSLCCFFTGCWGSSQTSLPEAPPPYPDSPFQPNTQPNDYTPPPSPDPRGNNYGANNNSFPRQTTQRPSPLPVSRSFDQMYTIEAVGTIWVLIQDKFGNELEWLSMMSGEKVPLKHNGPLTITCSSGESLKIYDPSGKPFQIGGTKKGISIIRLP